MATPFAPPRKAMYGLIGGNQFCNYIVRFCLPSLIQVASKELNLSDAHKAMLLSAHTPGYLLSQVPASMATKRVGPKRLLTLNTGGAALVIMMIPFAAGRGPRGAPLTASTPLCLD
jgi:nitrate/nitrite transporter NarK